MSRVRILGFMASCLLVVSLVCSSGCSPKKDERVVAVDGAAMGTTYTIKIVPPGPGLDEAALAVRIEKCLEELEDLLSTWRPDSEISSFNRTAGQAWFPVAPDTFEVVTAAQGIAAASGGAFDITVGPLVDLWGFGAGSKERQKVPTDREIETIQRQTGFRKLRLRLEPPALAKDHPELQLDLSAIAKGYAVDRLAMLVEEAGVTDYLVELGGELRVRGSRGGKSWTVGVEVPEPGATGVHTVLRLGDCALATSGDYRNYREEGGRRYSHAIDPVSGRPVSHDLASVTVVAVTCTEADGWATALMVLGPEFGLRLAEKRGLAALFLVRQDQGFAHLTTTAFQRRFPNQRP